MGAEQFQTYQYPNLDDIIPGCVNFRWREALLLPKWSMFVYPTLTVYQNIIKTARILDIVHNMFGHPVNVHCFWRPQVYNDAIGGAHLSSHIEGKACDFSVFTVDCDSVRAKLIPQMDRLDIRIEDRPGSNWVHLDWRQPGPEGRLFKP
jgi:hypothetical protein